MSVAALCVLLKLINEQQQRCSMLLTGVHFIPVAKISDRLFEQSIELEVLPIFAVAYGADATRKSNRQR